MSTAVLKVFGTGQITIPKKWREKRKSNIFLAKEEGNKIILEPVEETEEKIFDANDFNDGEGVEINEFIQALENSLK